MPKYVHARLHTDTDDHELLLEVCDTPETLRYGMTQRQDWAPANGMLFVFPKEGDHTMWMKDTPLPIDMVFLDDDQQVVGIHQGAVPYSTEPLGASQPSKYVLELPAGTALALDLEEGDRLSLSEDPDGSGTPSA